MEFLKVNNVLIKGEEIGNTLITMGSHDRIMDIITAEMKKSNEKYFLTSTHVGSKGGIKAVKGEEAHMATIHLLDPNTGVYNISYVEKNFPDIKMSLIKGVKRIQGFMVPKGNPKSIKNFADLIREDIIFVNRKKGSGTRILVQYHLEKAGISENQIRTYDEEMKTHKSVAVIVKSNKADVGVGIYTMAKAMGLDFIPIGEEHYDFIIPTDYLEIEIVKSFLKVLNSQSFKEQLLEIGGYGIDGIGKIIHI